MFSLEHYHALRHGSGIADRSHRGRLRLKGEDRRSYLQGLLTNDIVALTAGTGCYAALLTPQGRMIADMRVLETGHSTLLDLPGAVADDVRARLEDFVFSEDVQITELAGSKVLGVYGPEAALALSAVLGRQSVLSPDLLGRMPLFGNVPVSLSGAPALLVRSDEIGVPGYDLMVGADTADHVRAALEASGAVAVDEAAVEVCRVEAGLPLFGVDMDADTIPLEAGIEQRAISFTKGCYVGQEIIIRVLHRGHGRVARRLVGLGLEASASVPGRGDSIQAGDRDIGTVTSAVRSAALGHPIALGYVHRDFTEPGRQVSVAGQPATVASLPFITPGGSAS
jgi:folate-binding protein YgfZ